MDRDFGRSERLITKAINVLHDRGNIDSKIASALVGFRAQWEYSDLLKRIFAVCDSHLDRERILNYFLYYMRLQGQSPSVWEQMKQMAEEHVLAVPDIDRLIEYANRQEASLRKADNLYDDDSQKVSQKYDMDWNRIFLDLDLYTPNGLSTSYANFKSSGPPLYREVFF